MDPQASPSTAATAPSPGLVDILRQTWLDAAATEIPGASELAPFLVSRLDRLQADGGLDEPSLLGVAQDAAQFALELGTAETARSLSKRLRRAVYEFLLARDAAVELAAAAPTAAPAEQPARTAHRDGVILIGVEEAEAVARARAGVEPPVTPFQDGGADDAVIAERLRAVDTFEPEASTGPVHPVEEDSAPRFAMTEAAAPPAFVEDDPVEIDLDHTEGWTSNDAAAAAAMVDAGTVEVDLPGAGDAAVDPGLLPHDSREVQAAPVEPTTAPPPPGAPADSVAGSPRTTEALRVPSLFRRFLPAGGGRATEPAGEAAEHEDDEVAGAAEASWADVPVFEAGPKPDADRAGHGAETENAVAVGRDDAAEFVGDDRAVEEASNTADVLAAAPPVDPRPTMAGAEKSHAPVPPPAVEPIAAWASPQGAEAAVEADSWVVAPPLPAVEPVVPGAVEPGVTTPPETPAPEVPAEPAESASAWPTMPGSATPASVPPPSPAQVPLPRPVATPPGAFHLTDPSVVTPAPPAPPPPPVVPASLTEASVSGWSVRQSPRQQVLAERMAAKRREEAVRAALEAAQLATALSEPEGGRRRRRSEPARLPDVIGIRQLVEEHLQRKRGSEAGALLQRAAQEQGGREIADLSLDAGDRCLALGQSRSATNCYLAGWRADPIYEPPLWKLADMCLAEREVELAVGYLERIAVLMRSRGDDEGALGVYRKIVTVAPERTDVRDILRLHQTTGRLG